MKFQVDNDFKFLIKWIVVVKVFMDKGVVFLKVKFMFDFCVIFDCDVDNFLDFKIVYYMMIFVKMFVRQIDDFKIGVGVVIVRG